MGCLQVWCFCASSDSIERKHSSPYIGSWAGLQREKGVPHPLGPTSPEMRSWELHVSYLVPHRVVALRRIVTPGGGSATMPGVASVLLTNSLARHGTGAVVVWLPRSTGACSVALVARSALIRRSGGQTALPWARECAAGPASMARLPALGHQQWKDKRQYKFSTFSLMLSLLHYCLLKHLIIICIAYRWRPYPWLSGRARGRVYMSCHFGCI